MGTTKKFSKKSHGAKKLLVKNTEIAKVGILSCFVVLDVGLLSLDEVLTFSVCFGQGEQMIFLRLQGKLTKTLTKLYDGLVDNLRTLLQLICPGKALAKTPLRKHSMVDIATIFKRKFSFRYFE